MKRISNGLAAFCVAIFATGESAIAAAINVTALSEICAEAEADSSTFPADTPPLLCAAAGTQTQTASSGLASARGHGSQITNVGTLLFSGDLDTNADATAFTSGDEAKAQGYSTFSLSFELATAHAFELTGLLFAIEQTESIASLTFNGSSYSGPGTVLVNTVGLLGPGLYTLVAHSQSDADARRDTSFSVAGSSVDFDLTLTPFTPPVPQPVPEPASVFLLAVGMLVVAKGASFPGMRRIRR